MTDTDTDTDRRPADLPDFPMSRDGACPFAPPPQLRRLHDEEPLTRVRLWDGSTPWLVTRYADQRQLLVDPRCSVDPRSPGYPFANAAFRQVAESGRIPSFLNLDDPEHARIRRMVVGAFTVRRIEAMRPAVQRMTDGFLDAMEAGPRPADLVRGLALPLPSLVICELLGIPYDDHEFFQSRSEVGLRHDVSAEAAAGATEELLAYLVRQIADKREHPGDDLLTTFAGHVQREELTSDEAALLGLLLLGAGHETTANMIALGTLALLEHPEQLAIVRDAEDPQTVVDAVEELLRYLSIIHLGGRRAALEDIEIGGTTIRAGEGIVLPGNIANREDGAYPDPDRLDVNRDARRHLAFGFGVHQCLGQPLARLELQVVFRTLFRRFPELRVTSSPAELPFKDDGVVYGVYELPVTW